MLSQIFVYEGKFFEITEEADGKFVADIATGPVNRNGEFNDMARVVGRFNSQDDAIMAAKDEINQIER